jgi:hypothetical protein
VRQEADKTVLHKDKESSRFLEASILSANSKFFRGNFDELYRLNSDDLILYNTVIWYFKGNS